MATVLITGGAGFIGTPLTRTLREAGYQVVVIDDLRAGNPAPEGIADFIEGDIRDAKLVSDVMTRVSPDAVVHLAAIHYIPYCDAHPYESIAINASGTRNVLEASAAVRPERVVVASTAAVYAPASDPHREEDELGPVDVYGLTKTWGEVLLERFVAESGVAGTAVRLFNVYGPGDTNRHLIPELVDQMRASGGDEVRVELGNLDTVRDYVHVTDVCTAFERLIGSSPQGFSAVNVGSGVGWKVKDVVSAAAQAAECRVEVVQVTKRMRAVDRPVLVAGTERIRDYGWRAEVDLPTGLRALLAGS